MRVSKAFRSYVLNDFGPFEVLWEFKHKGHHIVWLKVWWDDEYVGMLFCENCSLGGDTRSSDCPVLYAARGFRRAQLRSEFQQIYWGGSKHIDLLLFLRRLIERARSFEFLGQHDDYHLDAHDVFDMVRKTGCEGYDEPDLEEIETLLAELQSDRKEWLRAEIRVGA